MNYEQDKANFALRCQILQRALDKLEEEEPSPRVWVSVMMVRMASICLDQEKPKKCLEIIIDELASTFTRMGETLESLEGESD